MTDTFAIRISKVTVKDDWVPHVTRHAILRYLERVWSIPEKKLLEPLQTKAVRQAVVMGAEKVRLPDCTLVLKDGCVVTVLDKPGQNRGKKCNSPRRSYRQIAEDQE